MPTSTRSLSLLGGVLVALTFLPFFSQFNEGFQDESLIPLAASRVLDGEHPYVDFRFHPNPGSYITLSLLCRVLGQGLFTNRLMVVILAFGFGWTLTWLSTRYQKDYWALVPAALFAATGITHYGVVGHHWFSHLAYLFGVIALLHWRTEPSDKRAALIGLCLAVAFWMLQSGGGALAILAIVVCGTSAGFPRARHFGVALTSTVAVSAVLWLPILPPGVWADYWSIGVADVVGGLNPLNGSPYTWKPVFNLASALWQGISKMEFSGPWIAWLLNSVAFLAVMAYKHAAFAVIFVVAGLSLFRPAAGKTMESRLLWLAWLLEIAVNHSRQDQLYINYLTPWLYLWTFILFRKSRVGRFFLVGLLIAFGLNYSFDAHKAIFGSPHRIFTRRGTFKTDNRQLAQAWNARFQLVESLSPPGSQAVSVFYDPALLYYAELRSPAERFLILPEFFNVDELHLMKREIEAEPPKYLYHLPVGPNVLSAYPAVDKEAFVQAYPEWVRVIVQGYQPKTSVAGLEVWERAEPTRVEGND
ncbi:MAG: hypothetical protein KC800_03480 [Candidatus Eremiobacteraeota bacterium]|nr:hypothetical protein [Candidatus Eremiobacteraeota bacterium]